VGRQLRGDEAAERVDEVLSLVGVEAVADRRIATYQPAMRRRLGVAQAVVGRPDVVLLDEPTAALDADGIQFVAAVLDSLDAEAAVIVATHDADLIEAICDRVAVLDHGRLVAEVGVDELLRRGAMPRFVVRAEPGQREALQLFAARVRTRPWCARAIVDGDEILIDARDEGIASVDLFAGLGTSRLRIATVTRRPPDLADVVAELIESAPAEPAA
jgi:ABC-type multidrug transport system ATPase subunit